MKISAVVKLLLFVHVCAQLFMINLSNATITSYFGLFFWSIRVRHPVLILRIMEYASMDELANLITQWEC